MIWSPKKFEKKKKRAITSHYNSINTKTKLRVKVMEVDDGERRLILKQGWELLKIKAGFLAFTITSKNNLKSQC